MPKALDLIGKKFGNLYVVAEAGKDIRGCKLWKCLCDCGNETVVNGAKLKNGHTRSCGCLSCGNHTTHGKTNTRLYRIWSAMKTRCYNENTDFFKHYGGRGIKVCDEWKDSFFAFYEWAIKNGYDDDLSIDRIDVNGDYEPSNCRWATKEQQSLNTRRKRFYSFKGETHTLKEWSKILNINYTTLRSRIIYMNWDISKAFREVEI